MEVIYWIGFVVLILLLVALDLGVFHKKDKEMKIGEALSWSLLWISFALIFNVVIYFLYNRNLEVAIQFFTGYLLEKSLSLDNIFVISLIFSYYSIPLKYQHRVLTWGILTAILLRGIMIVAGVAVVQEFSWILYFFGAFLLFSGIRLLLIKHEGVPPQENFIISLVSRYFPVSHELHHNHFFIKENGKWLITPLFLALIQIETADVVFAVDSIPAIFAVTLDPFIIFTSNIFAILGLRALYFTLAPMISRFWILKSGLALILAYIGFKMLLAGFFHIPNLVSLSIILTILAGSILLSIIFPKETFIRLKIPFGDEMIQLYSFTVKQARRIIILVIGTTVILIGIAMIFLPGPATLIIPLGLLILSTEFVWAKKFMDKIKRMIKK